MQVTPNPENAYKIGGINIDRKLVDPAKLEDIAAKAGELKVEGKDEWEGIAKRSKTEMSEEDWALAQDFAKTAGGARKELKKAFKESGYKDQKLKEELANVNVFFEGWDRVAKAYKEASGLAAVQAVAGASFSYMATLGAYAAYAGLSQGNLKELATYLDDLHEGKSHTIFEGNKVQQFIQEDVWPEMNRLLKSGVESAKAGNPVEVNAQYYELTSPEIVGGLAENAKAGNKVRVNVDAGRLLAYEKTSTPTIDEVPDKLRSLLQLMQTDGDIAVSAYPVSKLLEDPNDLMHRKLLRVGDEVLLSGMNANAGSGENIDAGYVIEGPAAEQLGKNFKRDVKDSTKVSNADIFGEDVLKEFVDKPANIRGRGLAALWDCLSGPSPAGTPLERANTYDALSELAESKGFKLSDFTDATKEEVDAALAGEEGAIPLSKNGREKFMEVLEKTMKGVRSAKNTKRLADIEPPSGAKKGETVVGLADQPTEREMHLIAQIQNAEKFIYMPAFVLTRTVAAALVAKREDMKAQGKELDIKIIADAGIYPDGGTPNEYGVRFMEDHGVTVRWSLLPRTGWHDRKIHAKQMLTDKGDFIGSTNFSNKGLRENWEHSGVIQFKEGDPDSQALLAGAKAKFEDLYNNFGYECNSLELATLYKTKSNDKDKETLIQNARWGIIRDIIKGVEEYEIQSGELVEKQAQDPAVQKRIKALMETGMDDGNATLQAVREKMGDEKFFEALDQLPGKKALEELAPRKRVPTSLY